jgi:hypothetical protein
MYAAAGQQPSTAQNAYPAYPGYGSQAPMTYAAATATTTTLPKGPTRQVAGYA